MSLRVPLWFFPILGLGLILLAFSLREWPFATIHLLSPLLAGMGVGSLGAIFVLPRGREWIDGLNNKLTREVNDV